MFATGSLTDARGRCVQAQVGYRRAIGAVLLVAAAIACGDSRWGPVPPSFVVISVDTLRADHLGAYGYERSTSPNIDALAANGVVFENVCSTSSWTLPAHASLLTGLLPGRHRLQDDGVKLARSVPVLAEALRGRGYETFAVVSHVYVSREFGLNRGFEEFDDSLLAGGGVDPIAESVVDRFIERLEGVGERPFFAFIHLYDPHWPYTPPPPFGTAFVDPGYRGEIDGTLDSMSPYFSFPGRLSDEDRRQMIALYDGEIAYLDQQIGRLSAALAESRHADRTVVILTADHGEEFKEHGKIGHGRTLFSEVLAVPLIVAGHPALAGGSRRSELASIVDIAPTVLDMAGLAVPEELDGRSLLRESPGDRTLFAESIRMGRVLRSARRGRYKLIESPSHGTRELYDLATDPLEQQPIESDPTGGELGASLADYRAATEIGWHLKLIGLGLQKVRLRGEVRTTGRFVEPRYYASEHIHARDAVIRRFGLRGQGGQKGEGGQGGGEEGESAEVLELDVEVINHVAEIVFDTDPPDAPVTFDFALTHVTRIARIRLGEGEVLWSKAPITLERDDPRLAGEPPDYANAKSGVYIRAVSAGLREPSQLSKQTVEHLEALGYGASEPD
jgi:arylsulfatase A-like enzyme